MGANMEQRAIESVICACALWVGRAFGLTVHRGSEPGAKLAEVREYGVLERAREHCTVHCVPTKLLQLMRTPTGTCHRRHLDQHKAVLKAHHL